MINNNLQTITVWHATNNQQKIEAVNGILKEYFPSNMYQMDSQCQPIKLQEGQISSQPLGDDETKLGSQIRAREIKISGTADFNIRVGVEGGLVFLGKRNLADITYVTLKIGEEEFIGCSDILPVLHPNDPNRLYKLSDAVMKRVEGLNELEKKNLIRFGHAGGEDMLNQEGPQEASYRQEIVEPLLFNRKIDLIAYYSDNQKTRASVVRQAAERAIKDYIEKKLVITPLSRGLIMIPK